MASNPKDQNQSRRAPPEVMAAVRAVTAARYALFPRVPIPTRSPLVTLRLPDGSTSTHRAGAILPHEQAVNAEQPIEAKPEPRCMPTPEAIEAAQEAALAAFPEPVQVAARMLLKQAVLRAAGNSSESQRATRLIRPSPIPRDLPERRPDAEVPPFPTVALDDPDVRAAWETAHREVAEARFQLQPAVLKAYAEAQLSCEKWDAAERGRKPSGDLRHPVPRNRLERIVAEMTATHERSIARAERIVHAIDTGDVVGVDVDEGPDHWFADDDDDETDGYGGYSGMRIATLVLQSELDRKAAAKHARESRTAAEIEAEKAEWDRIVDEMMANLPPEAPEPEIPNLPHLPTDREPTEGELWAFSNAVRKHLAYLKKGEQIEAKRQKDAETKVRTAAKREADQADPQGAALARDALRRSKAAERQRRLRARQKATKNT